MFLGLEGAPNEDRLDIRHHCALSLHDISAGNLTVLYLGRGRLSSKQKAYLSGIWQRIQQPEEPVGYRRWGARR